jgi:hypothetical protein
MTFKFFDKVERDASIFVTTVGDRGMDKLSPSVDALMKSWNDFSKTKKKDELESPEWILLEKAYLKHLEWRFAYPQKVYKNQLISSWIIIGMILILVIGGLAFSLIQLLGAMKLGDISSLNTDVSIQTASQLSFRSTMVGATVLVFSLLFFYLYLRHVFSDKEKLPPHVSISETDAQKIFKNIKEDES